jgi:uncharacterized protein YwgA
LTGVVVAADDDPRISAWKADLRRAIFALEPFHVELESPIPLQGARFFPDNYGVVPRASDGLEDLARVVIETTHRHFKFDKKGLSAFTYHMYLAENIPEHVKPAVAKEIGKLWKSVKLEVDRIVVARVHGTSITRDPIYFGTRRDEIDINQHIPDDYEDRWILASMFVHKIPVDSRLRMQKMLFLQDEVEPRAHHFSFVPQRYGPYSYDIQDRTDKFVKKGTLTVDDKLIHTLTTLGEKVAAQCYLKLDEHERTRIAKWMRDNGHRSTDELLTKVHGDHADLHVLERNWPDD